MNGWDYGRAHGELYNFWISSPVTKEVLANELESYLDVDTINENFKSQFGHNVQVFDDSILLRKHESNFFQERNNQFNLYWTVTPPYYLYLSDCCHIKTDIKSYNFLGFGFNQQTNYLVVKQTLPFTKRLDTEEKFPTIESKHLLNGCGEIINHWIGHMMSLLTLLEMEIFYLWEQKVWRLLPLKAACNVTGRFFAFIQRI